MRALAPVVAFASRSSLFRAGLDHSPLSARSAFRISPLMRAASCEDASINFTQRWLSPSIFACCNKYVACRIASKELLRSCARTRKRATSSALLLFDPAVLGLAIFDSVLGSWFLALEVRH